MNPSEEKTVILIKPDGVKRGLVGEILSRIEKRGLKIIALEMVQATREQVDNHYPKDDVWIKRLGEKTLSNYEKYKIDPIEKLGTKDPTEIGKMVRGWLLDFIVSGPIVKAVIKGVHSTDMVRKLCGNTMPSVADVGTIRGDFSADSPAQANSSKRPVYNIIHASETPEEAQSEFNLWFSNTEIHNYKRSEDDFLL